MPSINDKIVLNFKDVRRRLEELPARLANKHIRRGMYAGAKLIRDAARAKVPVETGALRAAITASSDRDTRTGEYFGHVYVAKRRWKTGRRAGRYPRRYAHLQEFGSSRQAARPFMRPALESNVDAVLGVIAAELRRGLDVEAAKLATEGKQ